MQYVDYIPIVFVGFVFFSITFKIANKYLQVRTL